jgi:hypothetical protein
MAKRVPPDALAELVALVPDARSPPCIATTHVDID